MVEPPEAHLLMTLRVAPRGVSAAAIRSLTFLAACAGVSDGSGGDGEPAPAEDCLLVFGGQGEGEPDMLSLLPMMAQPAAGATAGGGRQIPWFGNIKGFCMVRRLVGRAQEGMQAACMDAAVPLLHVLHSG